MLLLLLIVFQVTVLDLRLVESVDVESQIPRSSGYGGLTTGNTQIFDCTEGWHL